MRVKNVTRHMGRRVMAAHLLLHSSQVVRHLLPTPHTSPRAPIVTRSKLNLARLLAHWRHQQMVTHSRTTDRMAISPLSQPSNRQVSKRNGIYLQASRALFLWFD